MDLAESDGAISVPVTTHETDQFVIGPTAQYKWWYRERAELNIDRGPWTSYLECFEAVAKRELAFCKQFGKNRLHVELYLRENHGFRHRSPVAHAELLPDYLTMAPHLNVSPMHCFSRPVLRHPDYSPGNILINDSDDVIGIIDWQPAVVLPLCLSAGILKYFQNWGDPISETLVKPETKLLDDFQNLPSDEQQTTREMMRRRIVHFYYAALTVRQTPDHFDALRNENAMFRAKLFD